MDAAMQISPESTDPVLLRTLWRHAGSSLATPAIGASGYNKTPQLGVLTTVGYSGSPERNS